MAQFTTGEIPFTQASSADDTGSGHIDEPWTAPTNALDSNDTYASVTAGTFDSGDQTDILRTFNASAALAAAIPAGATSIDGVTIRINGYSDHATNVLLDLVQLLDAAGGLSGTNLAAGEVAMGTDPAAVFTFGSATEKWGLGAGLTRTLLIDPQFGVGIGVIARQANSQVWIDYVTIEVNYSAPGTVFGTVASPFTFGETAFGRIAYRGAAAQAWSLGEVVAGRLGARASLAASFTFEQLAQGESYLRGIVDLPLVLGETVSGTNVLRGAVSLEELLSVVTQGDISAGAETYFGIVDSPFALQLTSSGILIVLAHPALDSVDGAWTDQGGGFDLEGAVDEAEVSDADYIRSELGPIDSACRLKLESLSDPDTSQGHRIHWRIAKSAAAGDTVDMEVRLYEGGGDVLGAGSLIASFTRSNVDPGFTTYSEALSGAEADAIVDYSDLYVELEATVA